ncbi:glycosyltransferase [Azospirillum sp. B4]|uniref:rhamnosyltransferase WsaF family glycosyltransferase n=1 Tax=Azospirillum sp. B4 TaxID=95605 RepID=UPI00034D15F2|nr:glycosyltransferase [Azospirillum sp. B4]
METKHITAVVEDQQASQAANVGTIQKKDISGVGILIAKVASDFILFWDRAYLDQNPDVRESVRTGKISAYSHWIEYGAQEGRHGFSDWEKSRVTDASRALLKTFDYVAHGNQGDAITTLGEALAQLDGRKNDNPFIPASALLHDLEIGLELDLADRKTLLGPTLFAAGLVSTLLPQGEDFARQWFKRLTPILGKLYKGARYPNRESDLAWWSRLVEWLIAPSHAYADLRTIMLAVWERPSPAVPQKERGLPQPSERMCRVLMIFWATAAQLAGEPKDALGVAVTLMREMVSDRERRCYRWIRETLLAQYDQLASTGSVERASVFDVLLAAFRMTFGAHQIRAAFAIFELFGVRHVSELPATFDEDEPTKDFDFVFLTGLQDGESKRYRVLNVADALEDAGYHVTTLLPYEQDSFFARCASIGRLVVFRAPLVEEINRIINRAHKLGAQIVYDIDDLFFEPTLAEHIRGIDLLRPAERAGTKVGIELYRSALFAADVGTFSTRLLAEFAQRNGLPSAVIKNSHGPFERRIAGLFPHPRPVRDRVVIAYFSGTWTHHADFAECEEALLEVMRRHPNVEFLLAGHLDLGPAWVEFAGRVRRLPFQPHQLMLPVYSDVDITLAPLEPNPYCESKSELKIFEAALFAVPCVATATEPFREAIEHGVSGFVARSKDDWLAAIENLVVDRDLRLAMGERARASALEKYSDTGIGKSYINNLAAVSVRYPIAASGGVNKARSLNICIVVPDVSAGSGGFRSLFRLCQHLSLFGHRVVLNLTESSASDEALAHYIGQHFGSFDFTITTRLPPLAFDLAIATFWTTARRCRDLALAVGGRAAYFVQDFEPWFYPLGNEYFQAEDTYKLGLAMVTYTPFLTRKFKESYNVDCRHVDMVIDRSVYYERPGITRKKRKIIFLARPEMPRRCYGISVTALRMLKSLRPELDIVFYGSNSVDPNYVGFPHTNLGIISNLDTLAQLYSEGTVGLSISPTNPSHVPFEMLACNLPVVDVQWPESRFNDPEVTGMLEYADPNPESILAAMLRLLDDPSLVERRLKCAANYLIRFPGPIEQARQFERHLFDIVADRAPSQP